MNTEITEGNRLIAEFDGWYQNERTGTGIFSAENPYYRNDGKEAASVYGFKYHTSWDWLHGAWEKFRGLKLSEVDEGFNDTYSRHLQAVGTAITHYKIEIAFERLVRAIEWHTSLHP